MQTNKLLSLKSLQFTSYEVYLQHFKLKLINNVITKTETKIEDFLNKNKYKYKATFGTLKLYI